MNKNILMDCPSYLKDFLFYLETIKGHSEKTVYEYYIDLRTFLRFIKKHKDISGAKTLVFDEIKIYDVSVDVLAEIKLSDVYEFLNFTNSERNNIATTRSRKISSLRTLYKYLNSKANLIDSNPLKELETPAIKKSLPKYLTLEESIELLVKSANSSTNEVDNKRNFCILTLFLNCGMRLSELVNLNINDIRENSMKLLGKGNKERIIYLNDACLSAISDYLTVRPKIPQEVNALFLSRNNKRISRRRVQEIVQKALSDAGLDKQGYSTHKLRHTAATLMYQKGGIDIRILKEILGHTNMSTTEIYTHIGDEQIENALKSNPLSKIDRSRIKKDD